MRIIRIETEMPQLKIKTAVYTDSSTGVPARQERNLPEFAFIGRSNVGKSSLINMLSGNRKLAHISSTPGKTQTVNRFLINESWYLVDLPGYGFAKVSKSQLAKLDKMIWDYIDRSENMILLFVLIDSRHELMKTDLEFLIRLGEKGIPFSIIFTKADKSGPVALAAKIDSIKRKSSEYGEELPPCFVTSAETRAGREEVLEYIAQTIKSTANTSKTE